MIDPEWLRTKPEEVDDDLACLDCGYNLRGLSVKGRCPECGVSISLTLTAEINPIADREWLARTIIGVRLYTLTILSPLVLLGAGAALEYFRWWPGVLEPTSWLLCGTGPIAFTLAIWRSTTRARNDSDWHFATWFALLRFLSAITAVLAVLLCIEHYNALSRWDSLPFLFGAGLVLTDALFLAYLGSVAWQMPGPLKQWGYATAARLPLLAITAWLLTTLASAIDPTFGHRAHMAGYLVLPLLLLLWPAAYAWIWLRRVSRARE